MVQMKPLTRFKRENAMDGIDQLHDDLNRMQRRVRELERQLADAMIGKLPEAEHLDPNSIGVESMVSAQTGEPMVVLRWFTHLAQLNEAAAREIAFNLFEAIEAAKSDAFLFDFARVRVGMKEPAAVAQLIAEFREFRQIKNKEKDDGR
jgi:hypothetical protein